MSDSVIHPKPSPGQSTATHEVLVLEELSPLPFQHPTIDRLASYLCELLETRLTETTKLLSAPSISELSTAWQCTPLEAYDAFRELRRREFDFELRGFEQPIRLWRQSAVKLNGKRREQ